MKSQISHSAEETQKVAADLAVEILHQKPGQTAVVLALQGDLGAGKTTFLQGFAKALGITEKVNSPTFVLMKRFKISDIRFKNFYHIDCYRIESEKDLLHLGFKEIISNPQNIVAIEWSERVKKILPKKVVTINFKHGKESERSIDISSST